ncbi:hypothetical protein HDU83_006401 [Entophlyctis luteolus]|nr:hypothetical protein HDU83_006401 [Entophlyctis luteolus]
MSDPKMIREIQAAVSIPVMAKVRIGHFVEAQILESIDIDYIDESEVLTPADESHHIEKSKFNVPFVCGCKNLGEALRRISEGAAMIRTKGEAGTGNVVEAVRHARTLMSEIRKVQSLQDEELYAFAKEIQAPLDLVKEVKKQVFAVAFVLHIKHLAGGVATPADAAMMMQLGMDGVFVGSGIFKSGDPAKRARAIVRAVTNFNDAKVLAEVSEDLGEAMVGINISDIPKGEVPECHAQVNRFPNALYKAVKSTAEAAEFIGYPSCCSTPAVSLHEQIPKSTALSSSESIGLESQVMNIYTDGACTHNGQYGAKAGVGVFFGSDDTRNISEPLQGSVQTNNRAELMAIIRALQSAPANSRIRLHTDSNYSYLGITRWLEVWKQKSWRRDDGKDLLNKDLWMQLDSELKKRGRHSRVEFAHVAGHTGNYGNEQADKLAVSGASKADV